MKLFLTFIFVVLQLTYSESILQEYVNRADPSFKYSHHSTFNYSGGTAYVLNVTSQTWLSTEEVSHPIWRHWVIIAVPTKLKHLKPLFVIGGSNKDQKPPTSVPMEFGIITTLTESILIILNQIPYQPVSFPAEPRNRVEDDIIAYTWKVFMNTGRSDYIQQLPMAKATVKAMDSVKDFLFKKRNLKIEQFVVMGGSKRGWTTWLVAAAKPEYCAAIVPAVIPVLYTAKTLDRIYQTYCFWPPTLKDYERETILTRYNSPNGTKLFDIIDPIAHKKILKMPKFIVSSTGDEFFVPDSSEFFYDELEGEKLLRYVPNTGHGLGDSDAIQSLMSYYHSFLNNVPRPKFSWTHKFEETKGILEVKAEDKPMIARVWMAHNPKSRDFRIVEIGRAWKGKVIQERNGVYKIEVEVPSTGYTAYLIELRYRSGTIAPMTFSTSTFIVPNKLPCKPELRCDKDIVLASLSNSNEWVHHIPENLKHDKDVIIMFRKNDPGYFQILTNQMKNDKEIAMRAIELNGQNFKFCSKKLQNDEDLLIKSIESHDKFFQPLDYASIDLIDKLVMDEDFIVKLLSYFFDEYQEIFHFIDEKMFKRKYSLLD
eukprot:gene3763-6651_t